MRKAAIAEKIMLLQKKNQFKSSGRLNFDGEEVTVNGESCGERLVKDGKVVNAKLRQERCKPEILKNIGVGDGEASTVAKLKDQKVEVLAETKRLAGEPSKKDDLGSSGEALDDQKVDLEHVKAQKNEDAFDLDEQKLLARQKFEEALNEQKALEYATAQKLAETWDDQKSQEYINTQKFAEALDEQMVEYIKAQKIAEALDEHKGQEYVKAHKFAACESPPNPLTDHKINEEALDEQKDQEYVKAQKLAACESPPNPLTDFKINEEALDNQKSQENVKAHEEFAASSESRPTLVYGNINEALDDQKDLENSNAQEISKAASENSKSIAGLEINESKVDWRSFHAKYPWIKKNDHKSIPGSRKLLNDIANDQLGGRSLQI